MAGEEQIQVTAVAFSALVQERDLAWEPPMRDRMANPDSADFVWRRFQYVFPLEDPQAFPNLDVDWGEAEERLRRFVEHARKLADASLLGAGDNVRLTQADFTGEEHVDSDFSAPDVTTGFMTLLRQCFSNDEDASFANVRKALQRSLHEAGRTDLLEIVKRRQRAHAALLNKSLEELVQEKLCDEGAMPGPLHGPDSMIVRDQASPNELLRTFWYGDQIHWGKDRSALAVLQRDPFIAAIADLQARAVALDFAHLYIGFAVLVEHALG